MFSEIHKNVFKKLTNDINALKASRNAVIINNTNNINNFMFKERTKSRSPLNHSLFAYFLLFWETQVIQTGTHNSVVLLFEKIFYVT